MLRESLLSRGVRLRIAAEMRRALAGRSHGSAFAAFPMPDPSLSVAWSVPRCSTEAPCFPRVRPIQLRVLDGGSPRGLLQSLLRIAASPVARPCRRHAFDPAFRIAFAPPAPLDC